MVKQALIKLVERQNLSMEEMESVMREIMEGRVPPSLIAVRNWRTFSKKVSLLSPWRRSRDSSAPL